MALLDWTLAESVVGIVLSFYILREFLRWKLHPFNSPAIVWVLHLALFWLPLGLFVGSLMEIAEYVYKTNFLFAEIHLLVLGFLTTVLIGFGTRVTLGHSGQAPHADRIAIALFWWTQVIVFLRLVLSIDSGLMGAHEWLFDAAAFGWIMLFIVWGGRYGKTLIYGKQR